VVGCEDGKGLVTDTGVVAAFCGLDGFANLSGCRVLATRCCWSVVRRAERTFAGKCRGSLALGVGCRRVEGSGDGSTEGEDRDEEGVVEHHDCECCSLGGLLDCSECGCQKTMMGYRFYIAGVEIFCTLQR
jgi:hypothetical protein